MPHAPFTPSARTWLVPLAAGAAAFVVVHPFDLPLFEAARRLEAVLSGDVRREWQSWQQYGQGLACVFAAAMYWILAPKRRRRLLDLGLAVVMAQLASSTLKMLISRPRPRPQFMDPGTIPGPWGVYPVQVDGQWRLLHGWSPGAGPDLWSMPSSHTLFAAMLSASLIHLCGRFGQPKRALAWVLVPAVVLVGTGRVVFGGHWPSDVVVGAAIGWAIGSAVCSRGWGIRALDWVWVRAINRSARPMYPVLLEEDRGMAE